MTTIIHESKEQQSQEQISNNGIPSTQTKQSQLKIDPSKFFEEKRFVPVLLADEIITKFLNVFMYGDVLYCYKDGVYRPNGEDRFKKGATLFLGTKYRSSYVTEALSWVKTTQSIPNNKVINPDDGLINVKNGLLNWRTGELLPHTKERLSTIQIPVEYDPEVNDEVVHRFIESVIAEDTIDTVFEFIGYCLTTDTRYEKAFLLSGSGGNGKSTFINMLLELLGKENVSGVSLQELEASKFKKAELQGKLVNAYADLPRNGLSNVSTFKMIVSGEMLNAERKFGHPFDFRPFAKLIFSANELPRSSDTTTGYYRRWFVIPFQKKFKPGTADTKLINKLTTPEALSTLLNYAIEGLRRLEKNGRFTDSETTRKAMEQYQIDNDNIVSFVTECCTVGKELSMPTKDLYLAYKNWVIESGYKGFGRTNFYQQLVDKYELSKTRLKGERCERIFGISLNDNEPFENIG